MLIKTSDFSDSFLFILLTILSPESVFWDKIFLLKDALFAPVEFWFPIKFARSSCNLLLVIGLSSFPWLANQGKLERPITSSRLQELLANLIGNQNSTGANKASLSKNILSQKTDSGDNIVNNINKKESEKSEVFINNKD